jgi:hypothetical protein
VTGLHKSTAQKERDERNKSFEREVSKEERRAEVNMKMKFSQIRIST